MKTMRRVVLLPKYSYIILKISVNFKLSFILTDLISYPLLNDIFQLKSGFLCDHRR